MKSLLLACCIVFTGCFTFSARSATIAINNAANHLQEAFDAASAGDTLLIEPGQYPDASLVISKSLTIRAAASAAPDQVQFNGTVRVQGGSTVSFQQAYFGAAVETAGSTVAFIDSFFNAPLTANGGKVTVKRCTSMFPFTLDNNASFEALRLIAWESITASASGPAPSFVAVQSSFARRLTLTGYKSWFGYNTMKEAATLVQTNNESVMIGNKMMVWDPWTRGNPAIVSSTGGALKAYNNLIQDTAAGAGNTYGVQLDGTVAELVNNTILLKYYSGSGGYPNYGIFVVNARGPIASRANIFSAGYSMYASGVAGNLVSISFCDFYQCPPGNISTPLVECLSVEPKLTADMSPASDSPVIGKGMPEAVYNNRDGTRNTMGYTGGPFFNPANYTSDSPMIFFVAGPQTIVNGAQNSIPVFAAASAGH